MNARSAGRAVACSLLLFALGVPLPQAAAGPTGDRSLNVLSYNVRFDRGVEGPDAWSQRRAAVARVLREADICALQEPLLWQVEDLDGLMPQHAWVGSGRDDGAEGGEYSPIFYRRDRFTLKDWGTFWLSPTPERVGSQGWDAAFPRIATWAILADNELNTELVVFSTHFDHRGTEARAESGILLRREAQRIAAGRPLIVMGDFNATLGSVPHENLLARGEDGDAPLLRDAYAVSDSAPRGPDGTFNGFEQIMQDRRIDHIFVSDHWQVSAFETGDPRTDQGRFASDHLPISVELRLP